jgi:hypothetical protein
MCAALAAWKKGVEKETRFISGSGHDTNGERYLVHRDRFFCSISAPSPCHGKSMCGCNESEAAKKAVLTHWSALFLSNPQGRKKKKKKRKQKQGKQQQE